jgi:hypothetical protein
MASKNASNFHVVNIFIIEISWIGKTKKHGKRICSS